MGFFTKPVGRLDHFRSCYAVSKGAKDHGEGLEVQGNLGKFTSRRKPQEIPKETSKYLKNPTKP